MALETQRFRSSVTSRRRFLQLVGGSGLTAIAGCSGNSEEQPVKILAAGSLQNALTEGLQPAVDVPVEVESHGSATVARMIDEGKRDPDIVSVADVALLEDPLSPAWYSVFTSNSIVIAYNPDTDGGQAMADAGADSWYEPLIEGEVALGRTDPDQDPLGYRTLFTLELASRYYDGVSDLQEQVLSDEQIYPETSLISQFETGSIDAAAAYRNMAVERDYEFVELPNQIDLSDPQYADEWYSAVSYTLPNGHEIQGGLISYGSTIRHTSEAARSVFDVHTTGDYLQEHGFILREQFPTYTGDVPERIHTLTGQNRSSTVTDTGQ